MVERVLSAVVGRAVVASTPRCGRCYPAQGRNSVNLLLLMALLVMLGLVTITMERNGYNNQTFGRHEFFGKSTESRARVARARSGRLCGARRRQHQHRSAHGGTRR